MSAAAKMSAAEMPSPAMAPRHRSAGEEQNGENGDEPRDRGCLPWNHRKAHL
jgi:hypothetical protein